MLDSANRLPQCVAPILAMTIAVSAMTALPVMSTAAEAAAVDDVVPQLRRIVKEEAASGERLLKRTAPVVAQAYKGKTSEDVSAALKAAGLTVTKTDDAFDRSSVIVPAAWSAGWGVKFDLYVGFNVPGGRSAPTYTIPQDTTVTDVHVGLTARVSALHEEVRKQKWFGEGTFIQEALAAWPVAETLAGFPILDAVDLFYAEPDSDGNGTNGAQSSYGLRLDFVDRQGKAGRRRRLECFAYLANEPGGRREPIQDWMTRDFAVPGAGTSLAADLAKLLQQKQTSYQRILWKATHLVQLAALDRELSEVVAELNTGPLKQLSNNPWQYGSTIKYLVAKNAATTDGGLPLDLIVELGVYRVDSKTEPTRNVITTARAEFHAEVRKSYREVVDQALFGRESAVHQTLLHEKAVKSAQTLRFVDHVEVGYDVIANHYTAENYWGFHVNLEFHPRPGDESAGARHFFTVPSMLDPLQTGSSSLLVRNFVPHETLGDVANHGGSNWSRPPAKPSPSISLTKKGAPQTRKPNAIAPRPTIAYGVGDLATLPVDTRSLDVENQEVYDDDLAVLARFTELETLDLGTSPGITDEGLRHLATLRKLKSLTLNGEVLSGTGFRRLVDLPELRELSIYNGGALTNQGAAVLAELKQLTQLSLRWTATDRRTTELAKLKGLRELNLSECTELTDAGLRHLATLSHLESLSIGYAPQITPAGIAELAALTKLAELDLSQMPLTDAALPELARIASLEYLELRNLDITLAGLKSLAKLPKLKRLAVYASKQITHGDDEKLRALLPGEFEKD